MSNPTTNETLRQAVIRTVCYFDLFDYPLTAMEIYNYLHSEEAIDASLSSVIDSASQECSELNGLYCLRGKEANIKKRLYRYGLADKKYKRALQGVKALRYVPGISFIGICNNLSNNNVTVDGDIDLFIVTKKNRMFAVRLMVTVLLSILRLRRHSSRIANRLCLSFYVTEGADDLSAIKLESDPYLHYWVATLQPIFKSDYYSTFVQKNSWVFSCIPNVPHKVTGPRRIVVHNTMSRVVNRFFDTMLTSAVGDVFEKVARSVQRSKIFANQNSLASQEDTRVVVSDTMLKFHENDRRKLYADAFDQLVRQYAQRSVTPSTGN